jgi:CMP-N-acetylneuraminic acid synthetase
MKAHSERVPNKNVRPFAGRPLYEHVLEALEHTYPIDEVIVNTDSDEIAEKAPALFSKVRTLIRPEEIQGDFVSMNEIISYDIEQVAADVYLQTHSTNPLIRSKTITETLNKFVKCEDCDSLFTVNRFQTRLYFEDGRPINHDPRELIRTQDLPPVYEENSCIYVFTKESFRKAGDKRIGMKPVMFEMDRIESIDIDDEYTFNLAEMLARYAQSMD